MTSDTRDLDGGMPYEIRDRDIGGVLDQSIYLFRDHVKFIGKTIGVLLVPSYLCIGLLYILLTPNAMDIWGEAAPSASEFMISMVLSLFSTLYLGCFVVPLSMAALIFGIASRYLGKTATVRECFAYGFRRLGWLVLGNILVGMAVGVGALLCLIPGLIVAALFYLFPAVVVLERVNTLDALSRSWGLLRGSVWNTVALILVMAIVQMAIGGMSALSTTRIALQMAAYLMQSISIAFSTIVIVVLYFAARSRVEHLDLELLTNAVDTAPVAESAL